MFGRCPPRQRAELGRLKSLHLEAEKLVRVKLKLSHSRACVLILGYLLQSVELDMCKSLLAKKEQELERMLQHVERSTKTSDGVVSARKNNIAIHFSRIIVPIRYA